MAPLSAPTDSRRPATSSAPFIASLVDVSGIIIYFNIRVARSVPAEYSQNAYVVDETTRRAVFLTAVVVSDASSRTM